MRRILFAPSFDAEMFALSLSIQDRFGAKIADEFEARIKGAAETLAGLPEIGTRQHGYPSRLYGFVSSPNWIFYRFTADEIHFLHIRDGRRSKRRQSFEV